MRSLLTCARASSLARRLGAFGGPVPEAGTEAVRHGVDVEFAHQIRHGAVALDPAGLGREHEAVAVGQLLARLVEHGEGAVGERHAVLAARLHALGGDRPDRGGDVDVVPGGLADLARADRAAALRGEPPTTWPLGCTSVSDSGSTSTRSFTPSAAPGPVALSPTRSPSSDTPGTPPRRGGELVEPGGTRPPSPHSPTPLRGYTDRERETVGFELARKVLSSYHEDIVDLRTQRGVGADAMDELERFYELKVSAGGEPNEVTLTNAEWQRAQSSPNFFLVVVSGVEGVESRPSVRIIPRPLDQLEQKVSGTMMLSGVRHAKSVTYEFAPVEAVSDGNKLDPGAKG